MIIQEKVYMYKAFLHLVIDKDAHLPYEKLSLDASLTIINAIYYFDFVSV